VLRAVDIIGMAYLRLYDENTAFLQLCHALLQP
jgi:hypothetical protein